MTKRTNQTDRTRAAIVETASEMVFGSTYAEDLTMQNVADAAGVSHRTLYRYFASRKELFNAVGAAYDKQLDSSIADDVLESFGNWTLGVGGLMAFGATHSDMLKRTLALSVTSGEWRSDRDAAYWTLFREAFPNLEESVARQDFAVLRHVLWSTNAVLIGHRFELTTEDVTAAVERAVAVLVADIDQRDRDAAPRPEGS